MPSLNPSPASPRRCSRRDATVSEADLTEGVRFAHHLGTGKLEAVGIRRDDENGKPLGAGFWVRLGEHRVDVGQAGIRDEDLVPVQDIAIAIGFGAGLDGTDIGAGLGLGHGKGSHDLAVGYPRQPPLAQRFTACQSDGHGAETLQGEDGIGERRCRRQGLADQTAGANIQSFPGSCQRGDRESGPTRVSQKLEDLSGLHSSRIVISRVHQGGDGVSSKGLHLDAHLGVAVFQKQIDGRDVHHLNSGARLATNAS